MAKEVKSKTTPEEALLAGAEADGLLDTKEAAAAKVADLPKGKALLKLERHPLSEKYGPPTTDDEVAGMAADIAANGQHEAIKLWEGKVLAGWTRYRACLSIGAEPRVENYTGNKAEAVAFGTNVIRRRLSSISKAYMGAQYYLAVKGTPEEQKQVDVAKQCTVSLNRLSQCIQLLSLSTKEALAAQKTLRENPEVTNSAFDEMLAECNITRTATKPPASLDPVKGGNRLSGDESDLDDLDDLGESDLTGGAIDALGGDDAEPDDEDEGNPKPAKARKEIGEGAAPIPSVGSKAGSEMTRPVETVVSKLARHFNNLSPSERVQFVSFTWKNLDGAVAQAITDGKVKFVMPDDRPAPKAKGSAYKKEVEATKPAKEAKPATPAQLAARAKFADAAKAKAEAKKGTADKAPDAPAKGKAAAKAPDTAKAARGKAATAPAKPTPAKPAKK